VRKKLKKEVVVEQNIIVEIRCDVCGILIADEERYYSKTPLYPTQYYYECLTSHSDWGNDSGDSIEQIDCCSDECLNKFIQKYLQEKSYTINFEFERTRL